MAHVQMAPVPTSYAYNTQQPVVQGAIVGKQQPVLEGVVVPSAPPIERKPGTRMPPFRPAPRCGAAGG